MCGERGGWDQTAGAARQVSRGRRRGRERGELLRKARGASCPRRLCELPSGLSAYRATILLTCSLPLVVGPSLLPSRTPSLGRAACRRVAKASRGLRPVSPLNHLAVLPCRALPAALLPVGRAGRRCGHLPREPRGCHGAGAPSEQAPSTSARGRLPRGSLGSSSSGLSGTDLFFIIPCLWPNKQTRCVWGP